MKSRKNKFHLYLVCTLSSLTLGSHSHATDLNGEQTLKAFAALEAQTSELKHHVSTLQSLSEEARESLKAVHEILLHQQLQIDALKKDHQVLNRQVYNELLNRINTWRGYYNASVRQKEIKHLLERLPDFDQTLKHTPMHPDIRLDLILQYLGLMFCEDESVVRAHGDGLFNHMFAHLYKEHSLRNKASVHEHNYVFENLREHLSMYWTQLGVKKEAIEHLYSWK